LGDYCENLECDILIYGHTHENTIDKYKSMYLINPGSFTGAYSSFTSEVNPTFTLLAFQGDEIIAFSYDLADELVVSRTILSKSE
jgi:vacuolar protein sorting-associated protein 29